jgi:hypothetical protein
MKRCILAVVAVLFVASVAFAGVNTYQWTGTVLEVTKDKIVIQKGKEKGEFALAAGTVIPADAKVGAKVTIKYEMKATNIEVKAEKAKKAKSK